MRTAVLAAACGVVVFAHSSKGFQAPAPRPLVPAAADSIAARPDAFYGQQVTIHASIERILSPATFVVDQDPKSSGRGELLVLVSTLSGRLTPNEYVTVIGEVVRQDERPAIRAVSVINAAGVDLARVAPPPLTAEEVALDRAMKSIGPAFSGVRQAVGTAGADAAAEQAATLVRGFEDTEAFWKRRGPESTSKLASDARAHAAALQSAITSAKWDAAKEAVGSLQQACSACHAAHREQLDDGSYRLRSESGRGN